MKWWWTRKLQFDMLKLCLFYVKYLVLKLFSPKFKTFICFYLNLVCSNFLSNIRFFLRFINDSDILNNEWSIVLPKITILFFYNTVLLLELIKRRITLPININWLKNQQTQIQWEKSGLIININKQN